MHQKGQSSGSRDGTEDWPFLKYLPFQGKTVVYLLYEEDKKYVHISGINQY